MCNPLMIDVTGSRFGRLTVIERVENDKQGNAQWLCLCDCGNKKIVRGRALRTGKTLSCGCLLSQSSRERMTRLLTKHGYSGTKLYSVYHSMIYRCENPKEKEYHNYGGRGISVCDEWRGNVEKFIEWALQNGYREGLQIDRMNNDGNYEPTNCRFVTPMQNCQNTRHCIKLMALNKNTKQLQIFNSMNEASRALGIRATTIKRMLDGFSTRIENYDFNYLSEKEE